MIEVNNLCCTLGGKNILSEVSFKVERGGFYGIIGCNGSGKTTLLKCLTRNAAYQKGSIRIDDRNLEKYSFKSLARKISLVPQHTDFMFDFSSHQLVLMGRIPYQMPLQSDRTEDLLEVEKAMKATNTWHLRNSNAKTLSGGEAQRVIIARALAQQTPVLMLDEPISNLDISHQFEIMNLLKRINAEGRTVIVVLHDLNLTLRYCDKILLLHGGRLVEQGQTSQILHPETIERYFNVKASLTASNLSDTPFNITFSNLI